jgi:hypothetical protein
VNPPPRERFLRVFAAAVADGAFLQLTLGSPTGAEPTLRKVLIRPVELRQGLCLSFVFRHATRDLTQNFSAAEAAARLDALLGTELRTAHLFTTQADVTLDLREAHRPRFTQRPPTRVAPVSAGHDRARARLIAPTAGWLRGLEATTGEGRVCAGMEAKFRQINKFVELLGHLLAEARIIPGQPLRLVDMGCGKGYLTFAAWEWLRAHGWPAAEVCGVEAREDLVRLCTRVAAEHAPAGLRFELGTIASHSLTGVEVLVALHACDTATDDALAKGVQAGARLLLAAPCCHREVRAQLAPPPVLADALRHGILREREAELVTDALRAALLEWAGYSTKIFEFIATEHTAKNLMIAAVRREPAGVPGPRVQAARELAAFYGIRHQRLAEQLGFLLQAAEASPTHAADPA